MEFINENAGNVGKREIARAFHLDADQKRDLKKLLRELTLDGSLQKKRGRRYADPGKLPDVTVLEASGMDSDGELLARPLNWDDDLQAPTIYMAPERRGQPSLSIGDRVLARLSIQEDGSYTAKTIRRIASAPPTILGVYERVDGTGRIRPTDKRQRTDFIVGKGEDLNAQPGDLVRAAVASGRRIGLRQAKVIERLNNLRETSQISLISIHENGIPDEFSAAALKVANSTRAAPMGKREDLRNIPLITIDGADARDFDDAVWAEPDSDSRNSDGWHLVVAIADVSWYVRPGDAVDLEARARGNSVYFPDLVVPMLPEALSNDLCSLRPHEDRACMAAHLWIDAGGRLLRHRFARAMMRSAARLTYEQVQAAHEGRPDDITDPIHEAVISPLYSAYLALATERTRRHALDLDLPERQVIVGDNGSVAEIKRRLRLDSHKLIEEFMICANVAAAEALEKMRQPCMYRVHDRPSHEKIEGLTQFLDSLGLKFAKGQVTKPIQFNQILQKVAGKPESHMVSQVILRSQAQAEYSPRNLGHFGLGLQRYAHFTSPIRRYADLLVHRALVDGLGAGDGGLRNHGDDFEELGAHLSATERRAATAERNAIDRFTADFLADQVGASFPARVNGVSRAGLFVTLMDTGADALVPIRTLPNDYYVHDDRLHSLTGSATGLCYRLGQSLDVVLFEASPLSGGLIVTVLNPTSGDHSPKQSGPRTHRGRRQSGKRPPPSRRRGHRPH